VFLSHRITTAATFLKRLKGVVFSLSDTKVLPRLPTFSLDVLGKIDWPLAEGRSMLSWREKG
jgi:hypothetical protein